MRIIYPDHLRLADDDPGAVATSIWVVVAGGLEGIRGAGNIIHSKGHATPSIADATFAHTTLPIASGGAGCRAAGTITPVAGDRGIG